jgi:alkanesulfonate monooxygenase SsuD/methylene tetrahydromethanopterin reductase-like flavin-dependent oxidoreductase (luciferase family)
MHRQAVGRVSFGITAGERPWLGQLGAALERLGFDRVWTNDGRGRSGITALRFMAARADRLELGLGVAPLSERPPDEIADEARGSELPPERLVLGVGSGASRSLTLVRDGVRELRELLPGQRIAVAAVGPRMSRLAGQLADVVLLNWATPARLAWARDHVAAGAAEARRPMPALAAYIRVALGSGARERLAREADRYARRAPWYAAVMRQEGNVPIGIAIEDAVGVRERLAVALGPYRAVLDEAVVRGLPAGDDLEDWLRIAEAAAPLTGLGLGTGREFPLLGS